MNRRSILGSLLGAITAGPNAVREILRQPPVWRKAVAMAATTEAVSSGYNVVAPVTSGHNPIKGLLWRALRVMEVKQQAHYHTRERIRKGFDLDIEVNKSWSTAFKYHVQHEREWESQLMEMQIREKLNEG